MSKTISLLLTCAFAAAPVLALAELPVEVEGLIDKCEAQFNSEAAVEFDITVDIAYYTALGTEQGSSIAKGHVIQWGRKSTGVMHSAGDLSFISGVAGNGSLDRDFVFVSTPDFVAFSYATSPQIEQFFYDPNDPKFKLALENKAMFAVDLLEPNERFLGTPLRQKLSRTPTTTVLTTEASSAGVFIVGASSIDKHEIFRFTFDPAWNYALTGYTVLKPDGSPNQTYFSANRKDVSGYSIPEQAEWLIYQRSQGKEDVFMRNTVSYTSAKQYDDSPDPDLFTLKRFSNSPVVKKFVAQHKNGSEDSVVEDYSRLTGLSPRPDEFQRYIGPKDSLVEPAKYKIGLIAFAVIILLAAGGVKLLRK